MKRSVSAAIVLAITTFGFAAFAQQAGVTADSSAAIGTGTTGSVTADAAAAPAPAPCQPAAAPGRARCRSSPSPPAPRAATASLGPHAGAPDQRGDARQFLDKEGRQLAGPHLRPERDAGASIAANDGCPSAPRRTSGTANPDVSEARADADVHEGTGRCLVVAAVLIFAGGGEVFVAIDP